MQLLPVFSYPESERSEKMDRDCGLSAEARAYLCAFYGILDEMEAGMTGAMLTDSISHNFIVQMIPHHRAAIEMSQNILRYTTCVPLQQIALGIIAEQTKSIADMRRILPDCAQQANLYGEVRQYQTEVNGILRVMFCEMENACVGNNVSDTFMRQMIPHHRGAVRMSGLALRYPICTQLRPILEAIITSQRRGIMEMNRLLERG